VTPTKPTDDQDRVADTPTRSTDPAGAHTQAKPLRRRLADVRNRPAPTITPARPTTGKTARFTPPPRSAKPPATNDHSAPASADTKPQPFTTAWPTLETAWRQRPHPPDPPPVSTNIRPEPSTAASPAIESASRQRSHPPGRHRHQATTLHHRVADVRNRLAPTMTPRPSHQHRHQAGTPRHLIGDRNRLAERSQPAPPARTPSQPPWPRVADGRDRLRPVLPPAP
jgi:hypothetical protein